MNFYERINRVNPLFFTLGLFATVFLVFSSIWSLLPAQDASSYFNYADQRCILGINNFSDVVSNLAFTVVGLLGFYWIKNNVNLHYEFKILGNFMAAAMVLVSIGSAFFHYIPTVERLFWDRVPMVLGFISLIGLLVADRVNKTMGLKTFFILFVLSVITLALWRLNYLDLRPYLLIQFGSLLFVVLIIILKSRGTISNSAIWVSFGLYILAKAFEIADNSMWNLTGIISGHTLKHLAAALAMYFLLKTFRKKTSGVTDTKERVHLQ